MSAQTGHIEVPAPVLARQPDNAESDLRKRSMQRAAWADRRLSTPARRSRNDVNCQAQQERRAFASAPIATARPVFYCFPWSRSSSWLAT